MCKMTKVKRLRKFRADFAQLQRNREKVPLEQLQTRYAQAYNALVAEVKAGGDWYADTYIKTLEREAFSPYWNRHNRWTGEPGNRWIYNDIIKRFWVPPGKVERWPRGAWIDSEYKIYTSNWPPQIKENTEK